MESGKSKQDLRNYKKLTVDDNNSLEKNEDNFSPDDQFDDQNIK